MNPRYRLRSTSLLAPEQLSNTTPNEESLNGKANDVRSLDPPCEKFCVGGESRGPETQQITNPVGFARNAAECKYELPHALRGVVRAPFSYFVLTSGDTVDPPRSHCFQKLMTLDLWMHGESDSASEVARF